MAQPSINYNPKSHIIQLDGIRGWAVVFVLLYHFFAEYFAIFRIGWIGVDLFFVLSGFLITGILIDSSESTDYYKNFYIKRSLRIFPIYYLVMIICIFFFPVVFANIVYDSGYYLKNQFWFWTYTQNWLFTIKGYPNDRFLRYTWSLCIEEQFYMFWPFLIKTNKNRILYFIFFFIILANVLRSLSFIDDSFKYVNTFARLDSLSAGALIAVLIRKNKAVLEKWTNPVFLTSLCVTVLIILYKKTLHFGNLHECFTFISLAFGCVLIWGLSDNSPRFFKFMLKNRLMIFFGKHSYGLYLYHVPLLFAGDFYLNRYLKESGSSNIFVYGLLGKIVFFIATVLIAYLSFKFIEKPVLNLRYKLLSTGKKTKLASN